MFRLVLLGLGAIVMVVSCKPQRTIPQESENPEVTADTLHIDPTFYITSTGDTLWSLHEEVEIKAFRVLKDTLTLIGVGDIMMGTNFPSESYLPADVSELWSDVSDTLQQADITFGNLEGVLLDEGGDQKRCSNPKVCYLFRSPEEYAQHLLNAGFDMVSLANNHAGDFGSPGRISTMSTLDSLELSYAGLLGAESAVVSRDGMKYGLIAFSPNVGTVSIHQLEKAKSLVHQIDSVVDVTIVSFHAGAEGSKHQHITRKTEMFYGEDRGNVYNFSRQMIDVGADVVFGHGPHVTRAIDTYKDRFIAYSLGNFFTYGRFNLRGPNGVAPIIKIWTNHEGQFIKGQVIPIFQPGAGGPKIDPRNRAIKLVKELTEKDFPESQLEIDDSGLITYLKN